MKVSIPPKPKGSGILETRFMKTLQIIIRIRKVIDEQDVLDIAETIREDYASKIREVKVVRKEDI